MAKISESSPVLIQCKACPWRKSTRPEKDIPGGYCERRHRGLRGTLRSDLESLRGGVVMACHESSVGEERLCAGYVAYAASDGNDIGMRIRLLQKSVGRPVLIGEQHERFEDTLPGASSRRRRR